VKVRDAIKLIEDDGWVLSEPVAATGSANTPTKSGLVTIPGKPSRDLPIGLSAASSGKRAS
jgi:predicted RNA binding protein YcfA (HicA-like mRNA interferase family)